MGPNALASGWLPRVQLPRYVVSYWAGEDPSGAARRAALRIFDDGLALPLTRISGSLVYPVASRQDIAEAGKSTLDSADKIALRLGFISVSPLRRATRELDLLSPFGPTLALVPRAKSPSFFELAELDLRGVGVSHDLIPGEAALLHTADDRAGTAVSAHWRAVREQQILALFHRG
jgi:hypothetical protein